MLLELLFAASLAGQEVYTQEECFRWNEERGETQPWHEAGCLISWIYSAEGHVALDPFGRDMEAVFSRDAIADIEEARSRWPGDGLTPGLDADPFCDCQDPEGLTLLYTETRAPTNQTATSLVTFIFQSLEGMDADQIIEATRPHLVTRRNLVLVREADGWRVDDILGADGYSFRASLQP